MDDNPSGERSHWTENLTERQIKEVEFARVYAKEFAHGTSGHNSLMLISLMADILDAQHEEKD